MIILTTSTGEQTLQVIPREYPNEITLTLRDDSTNTEVSYSLENQEWQDYNNEWEVANFNWNDSGVSFYEDNGYLYIVVELGLVEGRYYDLSIKDNSNNNIIYKDKIFCTDQTINQDTNNYYSVNTNQYVTEDSYDNDYIII
jgi:hypothetical protein